MKDMKSFGLFGKGNFSRKISVPRSVRTRTRTGSLLVLLVLMSSSFLIALPAGLINLSSAASSPTQSASTLGSNSNTTNPGTVMSNYPLIQSHLVQKENNLVYVTNFGNYTFAKSTPWIVSFTSRAGQLLSPESMFSVNSSLPVTILNSSILIQTASLFSVSYWLQSTVQILGNMTVTYNFDYEPVNQVPLEPKITVNFVPSPTTTNLSVSWLILPVDQYIQGNSVHSTPIGIGNTTQVVQGVIKVTSNYSLQELIGVGADKALLVGPSSDSTTWANQRPGGVLYANWADSGVVPSVKQGLIPTMAAIHGKGIEITFPAGFYNIDPTLSSALMPGATDGSSQRKTFFSDGLFWAFYATKGWLEYSTSVNGSIFSSPKNLSIAASSGASFSVYNNNASTMYLAVANYAASGSYQKGLLLNNGTIIWSEATTFTASSYYLSSPSVSLDSLGDVFVSVLAAAQSGGTSYYYFYENGNLIQTATASLEAGVTLGNPTASTFSSIGYCYAESFVAPATGTVGEVQAYVDVADIGVFHVGIYNSTGSLIVSGSEDATTNGVQTVTGTFTSTIILGGQTYYLAIAPPMNEYMYMSSSTGGSSIEGNSCTSLQSSPSGFGSASTNTFDIWAPMTTLQTSEYQAPMSLPTAHNDSYFLFGAPGGLYGKNYNSSSPGASLLQSVHGTISGISGIFSITPSNVGDELLVAVASRNSPPSNVNQTQSGSFTQQVSYGYDGYVALWLGYASSTSSDTIGVTLPGSSYADVFIYDISPVSGFTLASYTSAECDNLNNCKSPASTPSYTPPAGSFVIGVFGNPFGSQPTSVASPFTLQTGTYAGAAAYQAAWSGISTPTTTAFSGTFSVWTEISAAFESLPLVGQNLTVGDNVASAVPLGGKIYLTYLQTDTSGLYSIIYKSYSGTSWSSPTIVESGITYPVHPVISINNATKDLYIFWPGYPQLNHVYYDFYNASSSTWSPVVTWLNATDFTPSDGMGYSTPGSFETISVAPYAVHGIIGVEYETGLSSPYSIQYSLLVDPPKQSEVNIYNSIQAAQDYLTRLERNVASAPGISQASVLSEYPALPITVRYSDGCWVVAQNGGGSQNGGANQGCSGTLVPGSISINNVGQTSSNYTYDFVSPLDSSNNPCGGYGTSPELFVVRTWAGFTGTGPTFQYTDNVYLRTFTDTDSGCSAIIYIGNHQINSAAIGASNAPPSGSPAILLGSYTGTVTTYPRGGGGINWGFDFNPSTTIGATSNLGIDSFRYTTRSALQSEWKWALATDQSQAATDTTTSLYSQVHGELSGATQPFTVQDVYSPQWFYGQSQPWNFEDSTSTSGGPYTDCNSNNQPGNLPNGLEGFGWTYPYASGVCPIGVGTYLSVVWGSDPLVMGQTAIQVLDTYGPNDAVIPWSGSTDSPVTFASSIINSAWYNSTYGIAYPTQCGTSLCPTSGTFSGDRTPIIAELFTLLGYKYGYTQFQPYATNLISTIVDAQWGTDTSPANNACYVGCGETQQYGNLFRPDNIGGMMIGWNASWQEGTPCQGTFCFVKGWLEPPAEFSSSIPTNQEATQQALIALTTYYNLVTDPSGNTLNDGLQPFYNDVFQNTGNNAQTHYFSANDIFASGEYVLNLNLVNEGDGYNRNLDVTLNGQTVGSYVLKVGGGTNSSSTPYADTVYTISVPLGTLLSTGAYSIGVKLSTYNYTSPSDWWIVDGSVALNQVHISTGGGPFTVSTSASPQTGTAPLTVSFTSSVSGGTSPFTYYWTFGDGGTSTAANPSYTYSNTGVYDAMVTVTDANSQQATSIPLQITVTSGSSCTPPPVGETFSFTADSGISGSGYGGGSATIQNNGCQTLSGYVVFSIFNSNGIPMTNSILNPTGAIAPTNSYSTQATATLPTGSYTVEMFVVTADGVTVGAPVVDSFTVS